MIRHTGAAEGDKMVRCGCRSSATLSNGGVPEIDADPEARTEVIPRAETGEGLAGTRELPAVALPPEAAPTEQVSAVAAPTEQVAAVPVAAEPAEAEGVEPEVVESEVVEPEAEAAEAEPEAAEVEPATVEAEPAPVEAAPVEAEPAPVEAATVEAEPATVDRAPLPPAFDVLPSAERLDRDEVLRSLARSTGPSSPPTPAPPPPAPEPELVVPLPPKRVKPPKPPRTPPAAVLRERWSSGLTVAVTVLLLALVVTLVRAEGGTGGPVAAGLPGAAGGAATAAAPKPKPAKPSVETIRARVSSVDPSGGSGLRRDGDVWRTQRYASATFGNLKDGVGLLLDLGAARAVTTVALDVEGPIDVELRAGDRPADDGDAFTEVAAASGAEGETELSGTKGGEHRYWLVWVTRLASTGGGYEAVVGQPTVRGPAR